MAANDLEPSALDEAIDLAMGKRDMGRVNVLLGPIAIRAAAGDAQALAQLLGLVDEHRLAYPGLRRMLLNPHDLDEGNQLTLIAVHRGIRTFAGTSRFTTWLFAVAANEARRVIRGRQTRVDVEQIDDVDFLRSQRRISSIVATRADLGPALQRAIADLPAEFEETLRLREVDGLSYSEIASRTGATLGTVKSRLNRARQLCMAAIRSDL